MITINQNTFNKKILIVDDEFHVRSVLCRYFEKKGFIVSDCASGEEALSQFEKIQPHIVLLDILMPGMNGVEVFRQMKLKLPSVKVVIISAVRNEKVFHECMNLGALDFVSKPFELLSLDVRILGKIFY